MGWGDIFAAKHHVSGDYFLMKDEDPSSDDLYLMNKDVSISIAGPLREIGWNAQYIIFTDAISPQPWNVINVASHRKLRISEQQRQADSVFKSISLLSPSAAWKVKSER